MVAYDIKSYWSKLLTRRDTTIAQLYNKQVAFDESSFFLHMKYLEDISRRLNSRSTTWWQQKATIIIKTSRKMAQDNNYLSCEQNIYWKKSLLTSPECLGHDNDRSRYQLYQRASTANGHQWKDLIESKISASFNQSAAWVWYRVENSVKLCDGTIFGFVCSRIKGTSNE